jgi:carbon-monoxide dehydrogenase large subunit
MKEPPHPVLAVDRVRHVGDPVAVVIAESLGEARDAAEAIAVDYTVEPAVVDVVDALKPGAPQVWAAEAPGNVCYDWHLGDPAAVDAAIAKAAKISSTTGWCRTRWSRAPRSANSTAPPASTSSTPPARTRT